MSLITSFCYLRGYYGWHKGGSTVTCISVFSDDPVSFIDYCYLFLAKKTSFHEC